MGLSLRICIRGLKTSQNKYKVKIVNFVKTCLRKICQF